MSFIQDDFYLKKEANDFFLRAKNANVLPKGSDIREYKKVILQRIEEGNNFDLKNKKILEIGCFIGDLLWDLKKKYKADVIGIEPSSLACEYSKEMYGLNLINNTFINSIYSSFDKKNYQEFDIIVADDVLSWMSRHFILQVLGAIDWILKPEGSLFIRDYSPHFGFAFRNHHVKEVDVFNYKSMSGHKQFFLNTGMYFIQSEHAREELSFQQISTSRPDAALYSDVLLKKLKSPLHPVLKFD